MSASNSNLSASGYNYDLVSALSQDALNANLKSLLNNLGQKDLPPITAYYKYNDATHTSGTSLMSPEDVMEITGGVDVFSIPDGTSSAGSSTYNTLITDLANAGFAYAFAAKIGLPQEIAPYNMPDILILDQVAPQEVTYHSYYQTFQIIELAYGWNIATVTQISQDTYDPNNDPWIFEWKVNLNLSEPTNAAFNSLPILVQQNLESMKYDTNSMFSMQRLYLDLNSPRLTKGASPSVFNFPSTDPIYASVNEFISNYWTILQNNGGVIFQTAIKPVSSSNYPPASVIPTAVNFVVSPYSGGTQGLYTLNYLMMSENRAMPAIKPFNWNWVDDSSVQGIMSVRRGLFVDYLNAALSPALAQITFIPIVDVNADGSFHLGYKAPSTPPAYTSRKTNPILYFSFIQEDSDKVGIGAIYSASLRIEVGSMVIFNGNTIVVSTTLAVYANIYTALATTDGYALATENITTFKMDSVGANNDNAGVLTISSSVVNKDLVQTDDKDKSYYAGNINDPSMWAEAMTLGAINDYLDSLSRFTATMNSLLNNFDSEIANICTNCLSWTFPGAGTYYFSNPVFSNNNDLTVQISVQPSN